METNQSQPSENGDILIQMTTEIVSAYIGNHNVPLQEVPGLIRDTYAALSAPAAASVQPKQRPDPAVPINKSIDENGEFVVCLEDGKELKSMKGYLARVYNMTPGEYRQRWGLPADYPMVAPAYAEMRSRLAKSIGLGRSSHVA